VPYYLFRKVQPPTRNAINFLFWYRTEKSGLERRASFLGTPGFLRYVAEIPHPVTRLEASNLISISEN
jgi:hypothetical protein